jgi:hypothetical protein
MVLLFNYKGRKLLFTGDMQFASPGVTGLGGPGGTMRSLRKAIKDAAPYSFVKIGHHGSSNAFNETILTELGTTRLFGICTGTRSSSHPSPKVLKVLREHEVSKKLAWARTDRNGQVTITFEGSKVNVIPASPPLNNSEVNSEDAAVEASQVPQQGTSPGTPMIVPRTQSRATQTSTGPSTPVATTEIVRVSPEPAQDMIEVTARIPNVATRVTITVEVQPRDGPTRTRGLISSDLPAVSTRSGEVRLGGGRTLPSLLFVTSREALQAKLRGAPIDSLLQSLRSQGMIVVDNIPASAGSGDSAAAVVRGHLRQHENISGVVLLGGYDVVPAQSVDVLPASLRQQIRVTRDPDRFVVWSDDVYGDRDGDRLAEIPVTRIPDGGSWDLLLTQLEATNSYSDPPRYGIRNSQRPFADQVFSNLPGDAVMLQSMPTRYDQTDPPLSLAAGRVYFMLHGKDVDGTRFWGEDEEGTLEAVNIGNVPQTFRGVVFTGCCWGALSAQPPAARLSSEPQITPRTPDTSIALRFLKAGALAFIGCTGAHYSPLDPPFDYFGGPMHKAFWEHIQKGLSPAQALFNAKVGYARGLPHKQTGLLGLAIEYKTFRQYTCLGLAW